MGVCNLIEKDTDKADTSISGATRRKEDVQGATRAWMLGKGEREKKESQALK